MHSSFRGFESYRRSLSPLSENGIQLILENYNSNFITYRNLPGIYIFKDLAEVLSRGFKNELELRKLRPHYKPDMSDSIINKSDNVTLVTELNLRDDVKFLRFDKKSFSKTILGFSPYWDYKNFIGYNNDYYSEKNRNLNTRKKIHSKCDVIDGSVLNGDRQPMLSSFILNKPPDYEVFSEPETIHYKKINLFWIL